MDTLILILLLCDLKMALSYHTLIYEYHAIHLEKTWFDAQQYCRKHYTDLATFRNMDDLNQFQRPSSFTGVAWVGLFDDPVSWKGVMANESNSWRWSSTGTTSPGAYQNWKSGEPDHNSATNYCGLLYNGLWGDGPCGSLWPFVCFTGLTKGPKQYTFISTTMSWEDAQSHCRQHYTDLAMIEDETENTAVASVLEPNRWTWFGLYRKPWRWSDGSDSQFKNWRSGQPNNAIGNQHCVWEYDTHEWNDMPCSELHSFVCAKAIKNKTTQLTLRLQSDVDFLNSTYSTQIIKKVAIILQDMVLTDFKVKWKVPPQKVEKKDKLQPLQTFT